MSSIASLRSGSKVSYLQATLSMVAHLAGNTATNSGAVTPVAAPCAQYSFPDVICMHRYGSVMPGPFYRQVIDVLGFSDSYPTTSDPADPSFANVANASFLVWNQELGFDVLGGNPTNEFMFTLPMASHEAPVYEPYLNRVYFSELTANNTWQFMIDLNASPPTLNNITTNPPLQRPAGSTFHKGLIYWVGSATEDGVYRPGIYAMNASTNEVRPVLNNYFGYYFNTCDDLAVAANGDIWFTDNLYASSGKFRNTPPQLENAVYRFEPSTGFVQVIYDQFQEPNGIAFSPDGSKVYFTDSGADYVIPYLSDPSTNVNTAEFSSFYRSTGKRTVYVANVNEDGMGINNMRPLFLGMDRVPDGIKLAANGYVATATGHGVDILTEKGVPVVRIQTQFVVTNICWAGPELDELWMVGIAGVGRVRFALKGKPLL